MSLWCCGNQHKALPISSYLQMQLMWDKKEKEKFYSFPVKEFTKKFEIEIKIKTLSGINNLIGAQLVSS